MHRIAYSQTLEKQHGETFSVSFRFVSVFFFDMMSLKVFVIAFTAILLRTHATEFEAVEHASIGDFGFRLALKQIVDENQPIPPGTLLLLLSLSISLSLLRKTHPYTHTIQNLKCLTSLSVMELSRWYTCKENLNRHF